MRLVPYVLLFVQCLAYADFTAEAYEKGSDRKKLLFKIENKVNEEKGISLSESVFTDAVGKLIAQEKAQYQGSKLISYNLDHQQLQNKAKIEIKNNKIFFSKEEDGKIKTEEEDFSGTAIISSNFVQFVSENWTKLMKDEVIDFRWISWDRMETVGFKIKKIKTEEEGVRIEMKPTSFIIAAIVDPIYFTFNKEGTKLLALLGRVLPKRKSGSSWKDLDADVVYHPK